MQHKFTGIQVHDIVNLEQFSKKRQRDVSLPPLAVRSRRCLSGTGGTPGAGPVVEPVLNQVSRMREVLTQSPRGRKV